MKTLHNPQLFSGQLFIFLLVSLCSFSYKNPVLSNDQSDFDFYEVFMDSSKEMEVTDFIKGDYHFERREDLNFGYTNQVAWVRIKDPEYLSSQDFLLFTNHPSINYIDFYILYEDYTLKQLFTGNLRPSESRPINTVNFGIEVNDPQLISAIYIRLENRISTLKTELKVYPDEFSMFSDIQKDTIIFFLSLGFVFFQFLYALIIGFREKERIIFWYASFVLFAFLHQLTHSGYIYLMVPDSLLVLADIFRIETSFLFMFTLLGFSYYLLDVNTLFGKWVRYIHFSFMGAFFLLMVMVFFEEILLSYSGFFIGYLSSVLILSLTHILITSVIAYRRGHSPALYLLLSQIPILLLIMVFVFINLGWFPYLKFLNYVVSAVIVYECSISLFILTVYLKRIKSFRKHLQTAQANVSDEQTSVNEEKILNGNFEDKKIFEEVSYFLIQEKAYLQYGLKLSDISEKTGYSLHDISRAVNKHGKVHFSDYVNGLRIKYAEDFLLSEDFPTRYTIETVALESGFKNRSSFYNAFKKIHNCTPGDFRRKKHSSEEKVVSFAGN